MTAKIEELTKIFSLEDVENSMIEELSHGMRQKVFIIGALLSEPKLWVLDEPLTGLDPQSSYNLKKMMRNHTEKGNTVLFSTHVLEVAEKLYSSLLVKTGIFTSLFIAIVYSFIFLLVDFSKASVLLDASLFFFLFGNILQTFTYFFNVFYESNDLEVYMAYPLNEKTVFFSKLAVVTFANIQLAIPIMSLFSVFYIKNDFGILAGILL